MSEFDGGLSKDLCHSSTANWTGLGLRFQPSSSFVTFDSLIVALQIGNPIFSELSSSAGQNLEVLVSATDQ